MKKRMDELARECGLLGYAYVNKKFVPEKISSREIQFFNAILELAAKECDQVAEDNWPGLDAGASAKCAEAIRKLKL